MIKASELRPGNLIQCQLFKDKEWRSIEVTAVKRGYSNDFISWERAGGCPAELVLLSESYKPISLSPEILEKCGFEKISDYWEPFCGDAKGTPYNCGPLGLFIDKVTGKIFRGMAINGDEFGYYDGIELKHLHQLQNLYFALTGEELNVQL